MLLIVNKYMLILWIYLFKTMPELSIHIEYYVYLRSWVIRLYPYSDVSIHNKHIYQLSNIYIIICKRILNNMYFRNTTFSLFTIIIIIYIHANIFTHDIPNMWVCVSDYSHIDVKLELFKRVCFAQVECCFYIYVQPCS